MVYCGKPSRACGECRLRRTKCDYKRPSCSQCTRAGRTCRGYRDPADLMFRDESQGLSARRQRLKEGSGQKTAFGELDTQKSRVKKTNISSRSRSPSPPLAIPVLTINPSFSTEEQATCFFFENYVLGDDSIATGSFEFLPNVYFTVDIGSALSDSLTAIGLVGLAHFYKASNLMLHATLKYSSAMRTLSSHLRSMEDAKSDQTFIAIMLLGYYEVNTCNSRQSMETWSKHMDGASALMQLRGKEALRTRVGYQLFKQLRTQVILSCCHRQCRVPAFITEWSRDIDFETIEQSHGTALSLLVIRYANLRASMSCWNDYSEPERLISTAYELDCDLATWAKSCPLQYVYQTVNLTERVQEVFSDHYHIYPNVWIATAWNHYRCARLLVNEIILDQLGHLYETESESPLLMSHPCYAESQLLESNATLMHLCEDICASVPYFLGVELQGEGSIRQLPKAMYANLLIWPLYAAAATWLVSDVMMNWVAGRLEWIADVMGIRQAGAHAAFLRKKKHLLTWDEKSKIGEDHVLKAGDAGFESPSPDFEDYFDNELIGLAYMGVED